MNLKTERGEIALPRDFRFDITANNPFFSDEGTSSVPSTIPPTQENRELLKFPENFNRARMFPKQLQAHLSHGIFSKRCRMIIDSASRTGGITASLALEESELYAEHQDKELKKLFTPGAYHFVQLGIQGALNALGNANSLSADYTILPVAADAKDVDTPDDTGSTRRASIVLNNRQNGDVVSSGLTIDRGDSGTIAAPNYYGIAPFFFLHAMLRRMFEACGYTVTENVFATDSTLKRIVVLHNTADSLCDGLYGYNNSIGTGNFRIHFEDMVPSMTVGEVICWIRDKFGAFVTHKDKEVRIRLFSDIVAADYDADLSGYLRDEPSIQHPEPKMLRVGCNHGIETAEPAAETMEYLRAAHSQKVDCLNTSQTEGSGLFYIKPLGKYYYRNSADNKLSLKGTDGYDYFREMNLPVESITADDELVPMILHDGAYMPFIGETVRRHVEVDDTATDKEQPLMICYARTSSGYVFGSLYNFTPSGYAYGASSSNYLPPLTPEGLAPRFFSAYRDILLTGAPVISAKLDIPLHKLVTMDPWTPKLFKGAKVLIRSLKYSISESGISACEASLQLLPHYVDIPEITDPSFSGSKLQWVLVSTRQLYPYGNSDNGRVFLEDDGLTDYTQADQPDYTADYPGRIAKRRTRWWKYQFNESPKGDWFILLFLLLKKSFTATETYEEYFISKNTE